MREKSERAMFVDHFLRWPHEDRPAGAPTYLEKLLYLEKKQ
jgi:hypothetical protein